MRWAGRGRRARGPWATRPGRWTSRCSTRRPGGRPRSRRSTATALPGGIARFYAALAVRLADPLFSPELRAELLRPAREGHDALLDRSVAWGLGLQLEGSYAEMGGIGGSDGMLDLERGYSFGYVTRRLGDHGRAIGLADTVEGCLAAPG